MNSVCHFAFIGCMWAAQISNMCTAIPACLGCPSVWEIGLTGVKNRKVMFRRNCCAVAVQFTVTTVCSTEQQTSHLHCWGVNPISVLTVPLSFQQKQLNILLYIFPPSFFHMRILVLSWSTGHGGANKQTLHMGCSFVTAANVCSVVSRNLFKESMR